MDIHKVAGRSSSARAQVEKHAESTGYERSLQRSVLSSNERGKCVLSFTFAFLLSGIGAYAFPRQMHVQR